MGSGSSDAVRALASAARRPEAATKDAQRNLDMAMERYVDGDLLAFDELYHALSPRIYGYLLRLVRDRARADDLLQLTFMRLHTARSAWARGARVLPWVVTIARNAAYDELRMQRKARVVLTHSGDPPDYAGAPEDEGLEAQLAEALEQALDRLPKQYRDAVMLTKQLDMTIREAATVAGTTETAMKLRLHRAYKRLRAELQAVSDGASKP